MLLIISQLRSVTLSCLSMAGTRGCKQVPQKSNSITITASTRGRVARKFLHFQLSSAKRLLNCSLWFSCGKFRNSGRASTGNTGSFYPSALGCVSITSFKALRPKGEIKAQCLTKTSERLKLFFFFYVLEAVFWPWVNVWTQSRCHVNWQANANLSVSSVSTGWTKWNSLSLFRWELHFEMLALTFVVVTL